MKDLINQQGLWPTILLIVWAGNVILTAIKTVLDKLETMLVPAGSPPDSIGKMALLIGKVCGYLSSIIDWQTGNKEH